MIRRVLPLLCALWSGAACAQAPVAASIVKASAPEKVAVTVYRDPNRRVGWVMSTDWPEGFAMISETRTVTLPAGRSTIRFEGVAESMAAVTAIVTGLPGGIIEKNRNAALLSPAALVDGTLGNRVTITRTNPATGKAASEEAVVRTRADGGLVLQTAAGYEAVRCSGLPERLSFPAVPDGLAASPVFSVDVNDPAGDTYTVTLSYLASGFDWQAHYVATFAQEEGPVDRKLGLRAWLTLVNDNGQSFPDAELMAVAGKINLERRPQDLAERVYGQPLNLVCYPFGSTSRGILPPPPPPPPPAPPPPPGSSADAIVVTGSRIERMAMMASPVAVVAAEEQLGDLKLYRMPEPVTVAGKSVKQVAFADKDRVKAELFHVARCSPHDGRNEPQALRRLLVTKNDKAHGLGLALPMGAISLFEPQAQEELLLDEGQMRDYAVGEDIELPLGEGTTVFAQCRPDAEPDDDARPRPRQMKVTLSNANDHVVKVRLHLGYGGDWTIQRGPKGMRLKDGEWIADLTLPANRSRTLKWAARSIEVVE